MPVYRHFGSEARFAPRGPGQVRRNRGVTKYDFQTPILVRALTQHALCHIPTERFERKRVFRCGAVKGRGEKG